MIRRKKVMKAGIMTFYYQSTNYGGNLQAYALAEFLNSLGYDAELISYKMENWRTVSAPVTFREKVNALTFKSVIKRIARRIRSMIWKCIGKERRYRKFVQMREGSFYNFNQNVIRHSARIYEDSDIADSSSQYDIFITGSDQVWNPDCYLQPFYLDFVPPGKRKLAYAASIAKEKLTEKELLIFRKSLQSFDAVSVRERASVELLNRLSPTEVSYVLDPTLLLDVSQWEVFCEKECTKKNYIFCYFLGENTRIYGDIKKFARNMKMEILNIPFASDRYLWRNEHLGDISITDAGPEKFLTLIRDASYIFTDSFHAVIFSYLFRKQFFVFNRDAQKDMSRRIFDLLELLNLKERFCDTREKEKYAYFSNLALLDYEKPSEKFEKIKQSSIAFLKENLSGEGYNKDKNGGKKKCGISV